MSWNYRLVRRKSPGGTVTGIHEAYYNKHGHVHMISAEPDGVSTEGGPRGVLRVWKMMAEAFQRPVLDYDKIGKTKCRRCVKERDEERRQIEQAIKNPGPAMTSKEFGKWLDKKFSEGKEQAQA